MYVYIYINNLKSDIYDEWRCNINHIVNHNYKNHGKKTKY